MANSNLHDQALYLHSKGRLDDAELLYKKILVSEPNNLQTLHCLGMLLMAKNMSTEAETYLTASLKLDPKNVVYINNYLGVLMSLGRTSEATLLYEEHIDLAKNNIDFASNCALLLSRINRLSDAINLIANIIRQNPNDALLLFTIGNLYKQSGQLDLAIDAFQRSVLVNPDFADARKNLANSLFQKKCFKTAYSHFELLSKSNPQEADYPYSMGLCRESDGEFNSALRLYAAALEKNPKHLNSKKNQSFCLLKLGKYRQAWPGYNITSFEANNKSAALKKKLFDVNDRSTISLIGEQGLGDQLLFCSLLSLIPSSKHVHVKFDRRLVPILQRSFRTMLFSAFDDQDTDIPNYSLVDLAKLVLAKPNDLCNRQYPYISPKQDSKDFRRDKKKVGLSWRSFKIDLSADKSIPLELLLKTLRNYDCDLVSLQYGDSKSDILAATDGDHVTSLIEENIDLTQDLDGVLSIIVSCDLIITSSSSVAHIAGAVGTRTILLLPFGIAKHWYWYAQDDQGNSLWYPSIRILGQSNGSGWEEPLAQLGNILNNESLVG